MTVGIQPYHYRIFAKARETRCIIVRGTEDQPEQDASAEVTLRNFDVMTAHQLQFTKPSLATFQANKDDYALLMTWETLF